MDGISRSRGWEKEILQRVLPMEQLVLNDKWARKKYLRWVKTMKIPIWCARKKCSKVVFSLFLSAKEFQKSKWV